MKYIMSHITLLFLLAITMAGCEQKIVFQGDDDNTIHLPETGYIFFNSELSNVTKGSLVTTEHLEQDFGVLGYKWDYNSSEDIWDAQETARPNVFTPTSSGLGYPQIVTFSNNTHSYEPIQKWEMNKRYAFFAYYPRTLNISGPTEEHTPYLTYNLPTNPAEMLDIMTASVKDMDFTSSQGGVVNLTFRHRLSAIDVQMINLNEPYKLSDGTDIPVFIEISDMKIVFNNLRYNKAKLFLDNTTPGHNDELTAVESVKQEYTLFDNLDPIESVETGTTGANLNYVTSGNPLIVIPQTAEPLDYAGDQKFREYLNGILSFKFKYLIQNGSGSYDNVTEILKTIDDNQYDNTNKLINRTLEFNLQRDLLPGRRYTIQLTFTRDATTIDILKDGDWNEHRSEIEFE